MKLIRTKLFLFVALMITLNISCEQVNSTSRNEVRMENEPTDENIRDDWKVEQQALRLKIEQAQERINTLLTTLENDLEKADDITKSEINAQIKDLKKRKKLLESDLEQIDTRVADNWDEFKTNVEEHVEDAIKQTNEDI